MYLYSYISIIQVMSTNNWSSGNLFMYDLGLIYHTLDTLKQVWLLRQIRSSGVV